MYEALETIDFKDRPGSPPQQELLGRFRTETEAIEAARLARERFMTSGLQDFAWWIVRFEGAKLARWIADSSSDKEFMLDLRSGQLVER